MKRAILVAVSSALMMTASASADVDIKQAGAALRAVQPKGEGHRQARQAWQVLSQLDATRLPELLAEMKDAGPLAENWFRSAAETIAANAARKGQALPNDRLEQFVLNRDHSPRGRRLAYELLVRADPTAADRLVKRFMDDPSEELRRDAVANALADAAELKDVPLAVRAYRTALTAARAPDQISVAQKALEKLGQTVNLARHYGFVQRWHVIAPFDNTDKAGFDVAYPPEESIDLTASYDGKDTQARWIEFKGEDALGIIDLNKALGPIKGAIAYAYTEFVAGDDIDVELRLGCINGNKVWLNGKLLTANHVYHANMQIDQYVGQGKLKKGKNTILIKVAQNEQEDPWAQRWEFQLRVCDQYGTAILSNDRPGSRQATLFRGPALPPNRRGRVTVAE